MQNTRRQFPVPDELTFTSVQAGGSHKMCWEGEKQGHRWNTGEVRVK